MKVLQNVQHAANLALQGFVEQVSMIAAELLGALEKVVTGAVRVRNTYKKRAADSRRAFGWGQRRHVRRLLAAASGVWNFHSVEPDSVVPGKRVRRSLHVLGRWA